MSCEDLRLTKLESPIASFRDGDNSSPGRDLHLQSRPLFFRFCGMAHGLEVFLISKPIDMTFRFVHHAVIGIGDVDGKIKTPLTLRRDIALEGLTFDTKPGQVTLPRTKMRLSDPKNFPPEPVPACNLGRGIDHG